MRQEFQSGLISANEYRTGSSRKEVDADLADSLLQNPNLIPIANTKKKNHTNTFHFIFDTFKFLMWWGSEFKILSHVNCLE